MMKTCLARLFYGASLCVLSVLAVVSILPAGHVHADLENTGILDTETYGTNPKPRTGTVTASVNDTTPPTPPILVYPENGELLSTSIFTFIWKESTDERGISKYQLYLDGNLVFDNISITNNSTATYVHTVNGILHSLTPVSGLSDGEHTWKVMAYDGFLPVPNSISSTTWSFTIDTTPPSILITNVGDLITSISSSDTSTIPSSPLVLTENAPIIKGKTEGNATVTVIFTLPGEGATTLTTTAGSDGIFTFTLPTLPLDTAILLDFTSTDSAGNSATLNDVPIIVKSKVIVVPPPFNEIIPEIPLPQPEIIKEKIVKQLEKILVTVIPKEAVQELEQAVDNVLPIGNSLIGLLIPLARLAIVLHFTGVGVAVMTVRLLRKALRAIYLLPPEERMGLVYDIDTQKGVPYALVKIYPVKDQDNLHIELPDEVQEYVSDADGLYGPVTLAPGQYTVEVSHNDYSYVTRDEETINSDNETLYKGEIFVADDKHIHLYFMIPLRKIVETDDARLQAPHMSIGELLEQLGRRLAVGLGHLPSWLLLGLTILMAIIAFFYFTIWNVVMLVLYMYAYAHRVYRKSHSPTLAGGVLDQFGDPLSFAFVQIKPDEDDPDRPLTGIAAQTDDLGRFAFALRKGHYRMQATWFDGTTTDWITIEVQQRTTAIALAITTGNQLSTLQQGQLAIEPTSH